MGDIVTAYISRGSIDATLVISVGIPGRICEFSHVPIDRRLIRLQLNISAVIV